jgi:hypothetical protein
VTVYRKLPVTIEAWRLYDWNQAQLVEWVNTYGGDALPTTNGAIRIHTLEGNIFANRGDYIIKGVKGEFYPCKPDIFDITYEEV